jgi:hypothetical protein
MENSKRDRASFTAREDIALASGLLRRDRSWRE